MRNSTILMIAAVAAGGYLIYKLSKPITSAVSDVASVTQPIAAGAHLLAQPIEATAQGASERIERTFERVTPIYVERQASKEEEKLLKQQGETSRTAITEEGKTARTEATTTTKTLKTTTTEGAKQSAITAGAQVEAERYTEYGVGVGSYLKKVFMPTADVAQERRQSAAATIKAVVSAPAKIIKNILSKKK